jgi:hypothetical protein
MAIVKTEKQKMKNEIMQENFSSMSVVLCSKHALSFSVQTNVRAEIE